MRVLVITNLFPNRERPLLGTFNMYQLQALGELCDLELLATIPWFPGARFLSKWTVSGRQDSVPRTEHYQGLWVHRPRTLYIPRLLALSGPLFAGSLLPKVLPYRGRIDVILAAWAYPDGCAAVALARLLGVPAVVKLHGSDVNVIAQRPGASPYVRYFLPRAARVVAVSRQLGERACDFGVQPDRVAVVYNGIDGELFHLRDRAGARQRLGLAPDGKIILYIGNVYETKGVLDLAAAFEQLSPHHPDVTLIMVGEGSALEACRERACRIGPAMQLVGRKPHREIPHWIAACDVLTLPSWNEGTPNVVLEALACGRRVVASDVGGIPDLLHSETLGEMVPARSPDALARALAHAVATDYDPAAVAAQGAHGDWADSARQLCEVLQAVV